MSLPGRAFKSRRNKLLLILAAVLLAVPCVAVAALTRGFDSDSFEPATQTPNAQEPSKEFQKGKEIGEAEARQRQDREMQGMAERGPNFKAELAERQRREDIEVAAKQTMQAALVNLAKISMDQAIQIALSQQPGKVLACSLVGEHWEAPGKLAKDGRVLYHTVIISGDEANPVTTHVLINALDGSVFRSEKEERGKERTRGPR